MVHYDFWSMQKNGGIGGQKRARFQRLKEEIIRFVSANPGCTAQAIVANLNHEQQLRNHGLTPRKVGFFITRNLGQWLTWWQDHRAGRRVYGIAEAESNHDNYA
jgi:hypothetical protein